jgi:predicted  nucleic acid-binding Zn-ribbon protein
MVPRCAEGLNRLSARRLAIYERPYKEVNMAGTKPKPATAPDDPAPNAQPQKVTKAQEIYERVEAMIAAGTDKSDAFKQLATEADRPYDSIRGSYYSHKKKLEGGEPRSRTRRRETTPEDAVADACAALERALDSIDREIEAAEERAKEAAREAESLKNSAADRKKVITERLEALR